MDAQVMPYIPTKEQKEANRRRTAKAMTDDELMKTTVLTDADVVGPNGEVVIDDRDWQEQLQGYILNGLDNALFGFGDEIVAAGGMLFGEDYDEALAEVEKKHERYREMEDDWSWGNIVSGGTGFVAGTPLFTGMYKGAQNTMRGVRRVLGAPSARAAAEAAGKTAPKGFEGVVAAAPTTGTGRFFENLGALGLTGAAAGEVTASGHTDGGIAKRAGVIGDDIGRLALNTVLGAAIGVAGPAVTKAGQKLLNMFRKPEDKAARFLAEKFLASGKTIDEFAEEYYGAAATGKPVAPIDVAPTSVRDAGAAAARMPGSGRDRAMEFLKVRQEEMGSRVADDFQTVLGKPAGSFVQTTDDIAARRAAEAKPHYDKAFAGNKPVTGPKVIELTNRPSGKQAMQQGLKMAQDEGVPMSELVITDANGNIIGYTMKAMHYGKMALDDMIDSAVRSGNNQAARNLTTLKNQWLDEMDRISPDYATGRKIYAGHAADQRALELGRKATTAHPDQIQKDLAGMSKSEQEFYRQGYAQKIMEDIDNSPDKGNAVGRIFGTKMKRDRMKAILGEEKYNELVKRYEVEVKMYETYADVNVGSSTAQRVAAQNDLNEGIAALSPEAASGLGRSMASGSITPLLNAIGWNRFMTMLNGIGEKTRAEIVRMLFSNDPAEVRRGLDLLNKHYIAAQRFQQMQRNIGAAGAGNENSRTYGGGAVVQGTSAAGAAAAPYLPGL